MRRSAVIVLFVLLVMWLPASAFGQTNPSCPGAAAASDGFDFPLGQPAGTGYVAGNGGLLFLSPYD
jgi:hypothetical protein